MRCIKPLLLTAGSIGHDRCSFAEPLDESEQIIRIARIPEAAHPLPTGYWDYDSAMRAEWAGIAISLHRRSRVPNYLLYWLDGSGTMLDFMEYESMEIVLDQARAQAKVDPASWRSCKIPVYVDLRIDRVVFAQVAAD